MIKKELGALIKNYRKPADEKELKLLIIEGLVPNSEKMLNYIKSKVKKKWQEINIKNKLNLSLRKVL